MLALGAELAQNSVPTVAMVVVMGGDAVVGQALALLLKSADYDVRFLPEEPLSGRAGSLSEAQLLLLAPGLSAERREAILALVSSEPDTKNTPVLELISNTQRSRLGERHFVMPWPCRTEDLKQQIEAALLADSRIHETVVGRRKAVGEKGDET